MTFTPECLAPCATHSSSNQDTLPSRCRVFGPRPPNAYEHLGKHRHVGLSGSATYGVFETVVSYFEDTHHLSVFRVDIFRDDLLKKLGL
jgi:hypothetical protein